MFFLGATWLLIGFAVGLSCGIAIGRRQKPWSELTERERKIRIGLVAALSASAVAGVVVFLTRI